MQWVYLILAIVFEITATTSMKLSEGFTKILPTIGTFSGYIICFIFLSLAIKKIDLSIAYAIWSAAGILVLSIIGIFFFKEGVNAVKAFSILFIILGVIGLNFSGA